TIEPHQIKLQMDVKALNDFQKLLGTVNWIRHYLGIANPDLTPLFDLLKGDTELTSA
ncbi:POK25 protein, partial [Upupa epops]|nr:POK25 protein [Upupa epops]